MSITFPGTEPPSQGGHSRPEKSCEQALAVARALADPHRYEILRMLAGSKEGSACACIRESVPVAPPTLSHHMKELRDAGLVDERREGRTVHYTLRRERIAAFLEAVRNDLL